MYSQKRSENRNVKASAVGVRSNSAKKPGVPRAVSQPKRATAAQIRQNAKPVSNANKQVAKKPVENQEESKVPASKPLAKKFSRYDSDNEEETEEERAQREYAEKILNADAAGRADSDKLSDRAK